MDRSVILITAAVAAVALVLALRAHYALYAYRARYRWSDEDIELARKDSVSRSRLTVSGKVQEHLAPLFPALMGEFNPRDARFLGSPVDLVVFDGLDAGEVARVVFIEVKSGKSGLSARERLVREAVEAGRVEWRLLRLSGELGNGDRDLETLGRYSLGQT